MEIYYQGYDITGMVTVNTCKVRDTCGDRCDGLEVEFTNAAGWYRWGPKEDDQIVVSHNGYDTGIQYVHTVLPEGDNFRIYAASLPGTARKKEYRSFTSRTLEEIVSMCAAQSQMGYQFFGIEKETVIPYIQQDNESAAAFLNKLLSNEGAVLKVVNGKFTAIDILYAQGRAAKQCIEIQDNQEGVSYKKSSSDYKRLKIKTPYAVAEAEDTETGGSREWNLNFLPARNDVQAGRWARGRLLCENRKRETLDIQADFNAGMSALVRVDVTGDTDASGEWLVEDVRHDFVNGKTAVKLHRCVWSVQ